MSTIYLKLGALNLACASEDIQLTASTSLTFLCSDAATQSLAPEQLSKALRTAKAVVKRGPGCRMDVDVNCDGVTTQEALLIEDLKETLGLAICQAPWWSQLPICPVLLQLPECFQDEKIPFSITLTDTLPDFISEDNHNEKGCTLDVKIPSGVPILEIQCIAVDLHFRGLIERTPPPQDEVADAMDISFEGILKDRDHQHPQEHLLLRDRDHRLQDCFPAEEGAWTSHSAPTPTSELDNYFLLEDESMATTSLTLDISPFNSQESMFTDITRPHAPSEDSREPDVPLEVDMARLLTDIAMRTLIGGTQSMLTDGVTLVRPLPRHTLAALMPLLFSPQFSSTLSQRSRFLSTITSTITSLGLSAQSPSLKSKLAQLRTKGHLTDRPSLAGAVQAQSYRIMHTSLFSAKAARSLLVSKQEEELGEDKRDDSMLIDGSAVSFEGTGRSKGLPTDDMADMVLEEMLEHEPLSEDEIDMLLDMEIMRQNLVSNDMKSMLLSNSGSEGRHPDTDGMIDLDMRGAGDGINEMKDGSMLGISEKSYMAQDNEQDLPWGHVDMLF